MDKISFTLSVVSVNIEIKFLCECGISLGVQANHIKENEDYLTGSKKDLADFKCRCYECGRRYKTSLDEHGCLVVKYA